MLPLKRLFIVTMLTLSIGMLSIISLVSYLRSNLYHPLENDLMKALIDEVKTSPKLPSNFVEVLKEDNQLSSSLLEHFWKQSMGSSSICPCLNRAKAFFYQEHRKPTSDSTNYRVIRTLSIYLKLSQKLDAIDCLSHMIEEQDFLYDQIGLKAVSMFYFQKDPAELTSKEVRTILLMLRNPYLLNPNRCPACIERYLKSDRISKRPY